MPIYSYKCPHCGGRDERIAGILDGVPLVFCPGCNREMKRDYQTDRPFIAAVPQSTFSPSLGREISDQKQVTEAMKRITEESVARTGYEPKLVARHRSEVAPAAESRLDPTGQALENAMRAAHDGPRTRPETVSTGDPAA